MELIYLFCIVCSTAVLQLICLIVYPVMFVDEVSGGGGQINVFVCTVTDVATGAGAVADDDGDNDATETSKLFLYPTISRKKHAFCIKAFCYHQWS